MDASLKLMIKSIIIIITTIVLVTTDSMNYTNYMELAKFS